MSVPDIAQGPEQQRTTEFSAEAMHQLAEDGYRVQDFKGIKSIVDSEGRQLLLSGDQRAAFLEQAHNRGEEGFAAKMGEAGFQKDANGNWTNAETGITHSRDIINQIAQNGGQQLDGFLESQKSLIAQKTGRVDQTAANTLATATQRFQAEIETKMNDAGFSFAEGKWTHQESGLSFPNNSIEAIAKLGTEKFDNFLSNQETVIAARIDAQKVKPVDGTTVRNFVMKPEEGPDTANPVVLNTSEFLSDLTATSTPVPSNSVELNPLPKVNPETLTKMGLAQNATGFTTIDQNSPVDPRDVLKGLQQLQSPDAKALAATLDVQEPELVAQVDMKLEKLSMPLARSSQREYIPRVDRENLDHLGEVRSGDKELSLGDRGLAVASLRDKIETAAQIDPNLREQLTDVMGADGQIVKSNADSLMFDKNLQIAVGVVQSYAQENAMHNGSPYESIAKDFIAGDQVAYALDKIHSARTLDAEVAGTMVAALEAARLEQYAEQGQTPPEVVVAKNLRQVTGMDAVADLGAVISRGDAKEFVATLEKAETLAPGQNAPERLMANYLQRSDKANADIVSVTIPGVQENKAYDRLAARAARILTNGKASRVDFGRQFAKAEKEFGPGGGIELMRQITARAEAGREGFPSPDNIAELVAEKYPQGDQSRGARTFLKRTGLASISDVAQVVDSSTSRVMEKNQSTAYPGREAIAQLLDQAPETRAKFNELVNGGLEQYAANYSPTKSDKSQVLIQSPQDYLFGPGKKPSVEPTLEASEVAKVKGSKKDSEPS